MALSLSDLSDLKSRCHKALSTGFGVGHADSYAADLSAELGQKLSGRVTTELLLDIIGQVEATRAGKPVKKAAPPPVEVAPEPPKSKLAEDEDEEKTPATAAKPKSKKKR